MPLSGRPPESLGERDDAVGADLELPLFARMRAPQARFGACPLWKCPLVRVPTCDTLA